MLFNTYYYGDKEYKNLGSDSAPGTLGKVLGPDLEF
jgi:hypothetical protein